MAKARKALGSKGISGNVDPLVLLGPEEHIRQSVRTCVSRSRNLQPPTPNES
jgi:uroporphyrinogen-III decarboxylase